MSDWSAELTLRFLGAYFAEPAIWDPRDARHKDRQEVATAWARVEAKMDNRASVAELKRKRENLMSTYRKLHNKVRASRAAGGEEFKPDWFAYDLMAAHLDDVYCPRVQPFKTEETEDTTSEYEMQEFEESMQSEEEVKEMEVAVNPEVLIQASGTQTRQRSSKKRRIVHEERRPEDSSSEECSLFLELLEVKLRTLGPGLREVAMHQIDNVVFQLRMQQNLSGESLRSLESTFPLFQGSSFASPKPKQADTKQ